MQAEARKRTPERALAARRYSRGDHRDGQAAGRLIGSGYRLVRTLARGERVWLATDADGRACVLKTGAVELVEHEHSILSTLAHPHIVKLLDRIDSDIGSCLVLEYLDGGDLVSLAGLPPEHWLASLADIADALSYVHERGLVHRDLKASNVRFDANGSARLIDFGSTAAIGSAWTNGGTTAELVRPRRGRGAIVPDDDVYAFAALLYEMLHGRLPGGARERPVPAWCGPLHDVVDAALGPFDSVGPPDLSQLATVIKWTLTQRQKQS